MALRNIPKPTIEIMGFADVYFASYRSFYYLVLVFALVTVYISFRLLHSRYGRAFSALRNSENLAESVGINHFRFVIVAMVVSSFLTGIAGSLYAHYVTLISPEIFSFGYMITLLIMVIGGGRYTVSGPVVGAFFFTLLPELLRMVAVYRMLIFGTLLTLVVIFMPEGIVPQAYALLRSLSGYLRPSKAANRS
jgi:branched-chain amino acid transport system permease protein